jgi:hypothetical protein
VSLHNKLPGLLAFIFPLLLPPLNSSVLSSLAVSRNLEIVFALLCVTTRRNPTSCHSESGGRTSRNVLDQWFATWGRRDHENTNFNIGCGVLTAAVMKSTIFWDIPSCRQFNSSSRLISRLLALLDPEDGGDMFFRNVGWISNRLNGVTSQNIVLLKF